MKPLPAYDIALVTDALGQRAEALRWLAVAESEHDRNVTSYPMDPRMDGLRHAASLGRKAPDSNA